MSPPIVIPNLKVVSLLAAPFASTPNPLRPQIATFTRPHVWNEDGIRLTPRPGYASDLAIIHDDVGEPSQVPGFVSRSLRKVPDVSSRPDDHQIRVAPFRQSVLLRKTFYTRTKACTVDMFNTNAQDGVTMADWLYPLSSKAEKWFQSPDGTRTADTSPASFEAMMKWSRPDEDWGLTRNYKQVKSRDRIWVYYGRIDGDLGVVGLARVTAVEPSADGRASVHLRWDKRRTKNLTLNPVPARDVRKFIKWPRATVENLSVHPQLVRRLEHRAQTSTLEVDGASKSEQAKTSTITYSHPGKVTIRRRHDRLIWPVQTRLETCGWRKIHFDVTPRKVDLAMAKGKAVLLVEFKTISGSTFKAVREAFAQLCEYDWRYRQRHSRAGPKVHRWAVFERQPKGDDIRFLEDSRILVSWANSNAKRVLHARETRDRLIQLSVVP